LAALLSVSSLPLNVATSVAASNGGVRFQVNEFLLGEENVLVHHAAESLLNDLPNFEYNPWVIFGPSGVGKSHLSRGLLQELRKSYRTAGVTGADFARQCADAYDTNSINDLRAKFRKLDLLLIEDIHELAGHGAAQQELATLIDLMLEDGGQFLATSSRTPNELRLLATHLVSRLNAGLTTPLKLPGLEAREQLLLKLAEAHEIDLPPEVAAMISAEIVGTVMELRHVLLQLQTEARLRNQAVDLEMAESFLAERKRQKQPTLRTIASKVSHRFQVKSSDLKGPTRRQAVTRARGVAMYIARQLTDKSLDQVGKHFGGRDHTTVMHAVRKTADLIQSDPDIRQLVEEINQELT